MKVSVIIPAYNAASYIGNAIDKIFTNQKVTIELIVVNDGSTDQTNEVMQSYLEKYPNIRYFSKENGGVSAARNFGLKEATGDYIMFCDADDYYEEGLIDSLMEHMKEDFDWIVFGRKDYTNGKLTNNCNQHDSIRCYKSAKKYMTTIFSKGLCTYVVNNKVFKRKIIQIHNIRFDEQLKYSEDTKFILDYLLYVDDIVEDFHKNYCRICLDGSTVYRSIDHFFFQNMKAIDLWKCNIDEKQYKETLENLCTHYASVSIHRILYGMEGFNKKEALQEIGAIRKYFDEYNYTYRKDDSKKDKLFSFLFRKRYFKTLYFIFGTIRKMLKG